MLASAIACATAAGSAFAAAQPIIAADNFFSAGTFTMDQGDRPQLQNIGANQHNATAKQNGPDGDFLFESPTTGTGDTTLDGTQYLAAGTYAFICTIHPLPMQASLQVSALGTPVARPQIDVSAAKGKLAKVAKKGKLPVTIRATTESDGVTIALKLGKATIGSQPEFDLAAGKQRKLSVKLTKSGRKKLGKKSKATVKVVAAVPFGAPDTAKSKLS